MSTVKVNAAQIGQSITTTNNFTLYQPATPDGTVRLGNGNAGSVTDLVVLNSSGNLGLGVTPSAWGSGFGAIQFKNTGTNYIVSGTNNLQIGVNYYNNGSGNLYVNSSYATTYLQSAGQHQWYTAASGTAGNAITFTQAMTLDASGNLGVGPTTPSAYGAGFTALSVGAAAANGVIDVLSSGTRVGTFFTTGSEVRLASQTAVPLTFYTNNAERMRIDSSGNLLIGTTANSGNKLNVAGAANFTHMDSGGFGVRVGANSSNTVSAIQFTNYAQAADWAYLSAIAANNTIWRTAQGSASAVANNNLEFNLYGGHAIIRALDSAGGDISDWPVPVLALSGWDSNFDYKTFMAFGLKNDVASYQTGSAIWNFRLYQGSVGQTTSNSNTALVINGPGYLQCISGSGGVQLSNGATSWSSLSDEREKDIIEPIVGAAEKVASLRTVIGKLKTDPDGTRRAMLIAQDVDAVLPEAVGTIKLRDPVDQENIYAPPAERERLSLSYTDVIPLLVAAIKEQQEQINQLKAELAALKGS